MSEPSLDGSLKEWSAIGDEFACSVLLLGNGLSINVWPLFAYGSLYEHAQNGGLTSDDLLLFDVTPNFERVLADLNTAIRVNKVVGIDASPVLEPYRRIQHALGHAVREVHVSRSVVPDEALLAIRKELVNYEWIFTTSYDLIIYWAMGCGGSWKPFVDGFRFGGTLSSTRRRRSWRSTSSPCTSSTAPYISSSAAPG